METYSKGSEFNLSAALHKTDVVRPKLFTLVEDSGGDVKGVCSFEFMIRSKLSRKVKYFVVKGKTQQASK